MLIIVFCLLQKHQKLHTMIISVDEGTKLATSFVSSVCAAAHKNNAAELMREFFADTVAWKSVRDLCCCYY